MNIREAVITDIAAIAQLSLVLGYSDVSPSILTTRLAMIIDSDTDRIWLFEAGSEIVGWLHAFVGLRLASAPFIEIAGIAVSAESRKQGVGRSLINEASQWSAEMGVDLRVRCHSERLEAHLFYRALGFSELKSQRVFILRAAET
ncbi:MAG: hypothetical protein OFPII_00490 [Osedax symbiont Rs1]|nr:MAG: hypothetical protein OFPII_00490 [Osedax symbiont Rs1]